MTIKAKFVMGNAPVTLTRRNPHMTAPRITHLLRVTGLTLEQATLKAALVYGEGRK